MKKHLGSAKAMSHMHTVYGLSHRDEESDETEAVLNPKAAKKSLTETQKLAQEVADLKKQHRQASIEAQRTTTCREPQ
jgi:hypothetical protein